MNKTEFLTKLKTTLIQNNIKDSDDIVSFYEDIIDGKLEQGISEAEIIAGFKDFDNLITEIIAMNQETKTFTYFDYVRARPTQNNQKLIKPVANGRQRTLIFLLSIATTSTLMFGKEKPTSILLPMTS